MRLVGLWILVALLRLAVAALLALSRGCERLTGALRRVLRPVVHALLKDKRP